jgi:mannosyltransferase
MDAVIATTEKAATFVPHVKAVVPHGVDTDRFYPAENREAAWAQTGFPGTKGVATIGRIRREKGTDRFVQSMLAYLPDHPDTTALVIGRAAQPDQGFLDSLKSQIAAAGLTDRILFTGEVAPDELPSLLRGLSAVIQLPRYEGYGMAPLEGMASGVPFVATDQGYYRSFSAQDRAGFITEDDTPSTVDRITRLLSDPVRHENMAKAARDVACSHFSIEREASGIAGVYDDLWSKA